MSTKYWTEIRWPRHGAAGLAALIVLALLSSGSATAQPGSTERQAKGSSSVVPPISAPGTDRPGSPAGPGAQLPKANRPNPVPLATPEEAASNAVNDRIRTIVTQQRLTDGFAGLDGTADPAELVLYWHGAVPAVLSATLADVARAEPRIRVIVKAAGYSLKVLDREARRIVDLPESVVGALVTGTGPRPDYSGVRVYTERPLTAAGRAAVVGSIPLDFEVRGQAVPADAGVAPAAVPPAARWSDAAPFYGGGLLTQPISGGFIQLCTSGFTARSANGIRYMLTSRHCGTGSPWNNGELFTGGPAVVVGNVKNSNLTLDTMALGDRTYRGYVFNGAYTSTYAQPVSGANNIGRGKPVFPSGALSGTWGVTVEAINEYINLQGTGRVGPGMWLVDSLGRATVGGGDSGGPVYTGESNGTAGARGIITAIDDSPAQLGPCQGYTFPERLCSKRSFATQINQVLAYYRLTIEVG